MSIEDSKPVMSGDGGDAVSDIISAIGFLLFAILMLIGATQFTYKSDMGFVTAAGFTPILLGLLVGILSVTLIIETIKRKKNSLIRFSVWIKLIAGDEMVRRSVVLVIITGAYILLVGIINFQLITFIFLFGIYYYLKIGKLYKVFIYSLANAILITYVIPAIYQMPLP